MDIGKYKQAMSYLLNPNSTLKTFIINPEAKLSDNDPIGYATGGRVGFDKGGMSILEFSKKQKFTGPHSFRRYLGPSQLNSTVSQSILDSLSKAGITFSDKRGQYGERFLQNVNDESIKKFEQFMKESKKELNLPRSRFETMEQRKQIKEFVTDKIKNKEYVSLPIIYEEFPNTNDAQIRKSLSPNIINKLGREEQKEAMMALNIKKGILKTKDQAAAVNYILDTISKGEDISKKELAKVMNVRQGEVERRMGNLITNIYGINSGKNKNSFLNKFTYDERNDVVQTLFNSGEFKDLYSNRIRSDINSALPENSTLRTEALKKLDNFVKVKKEIEKKFGDVIELEHPLARNIIATAQRSPGEAYLKVTPVSREFNRYKSYFDTERGKIQRKVLDALEKGEDTTDLVKELKTKETAMQTLFGDYDIGRISSKGGIIRYGSKSLFESDLNKLLKDNLVLVDNLKNNINLNRENLVSLFNEAKLNVNMLDKALELKSPKVTTTDIDKIQNILNKAGVTNEESKAINLISNQLNSGIDPELLGKLFSKEIGLVTNAAKKITSAGIDVADIFISIGKTPAGRIAGGAITSLFAAPELSRGNYKQAVRDVIPWFESLKIPKTDIDIGIGSKQGDLIKYAEEKNYDQNSLNKIYKANDIQNEIDSLTSKIENLKNQTYTEDPLGGGYTNFDDVIKKSQLELEALEKQKKELNIKKSDWQNLFNTAYSFNEEKYGSHKQNLFGKYILSRSDPDKDVLEQELYRDIGKLNQNLLLEHNIYIPEKKDEQPLQENLTDYSYVSAAEGGRIGFKDGTEDPNEKPVIPIDPLSDDTKPTNIMDTKFTRREILGGLGVAAGVPIVAKLIQEGKATKVAQAAKLASKIKLEQAEGMYPWFPKLIEKIKVKGQPFEEKELIMEASYKHEPKGYGGLPKGIEKLTKHVDGDTTFVLREYPDGRIAVDILSPRNQEFGDTPVTLYYRPTMKLKYYNGEKIEPAEFRVLEKEPRYFANGPDDVDIEMTETVKIPGKNTVYGDVEAAERFATGKIENRKIIPAKQMRRDQMTDQPVDFIEETSPYGPVYD